MTDKRLKKELLAQGASKNEVENLTRLAEQLSAVKPRGLSAHAKQRILDQLKIDPPKERRPIFRWAALGGSLTGAMALIALLILPGMLQPKTAPTNENDVRSLIQPVEDELKQLDMEIEQLQQQPTVTEAELKEAEEKYERTLRDLKNKHQNRKEFKNYDWNKWRRDFPTQYNDKSPDKNNREEVTRKRQNTNSENN
ncbi:hypothetical protein IRY61_06600, partial [Candidatus Saccharibacteria bacterium]|nr:hypothetical protein [Candidatus Saccharibacteria bacterium]